MPETMTSKERVMKLFAREKTDRPACFSGMGNVTTEGLNKLGYKFAQVHMDAKQMALCAASTPELFGYDCCVLPFDLCVEAEALGCQINTYASNIDLLYPTIKEKVIHNESEMDIAIPSGIADRGRVPLMREAIGIAKKQLNDKVPVGSYVLGPFTLAGQIMELNDLLKLSFKKPDKVNALMEKLCGVIVAVAKEYEKAGVDYLAVREMGATSDVLSPRAFNKLIMPHLQSIFKEIKVPTVLHICGKTNDIVEAMSKDSGATAVSVDQKNDLVETRNKLGNQALVFGNFDPYNVLVSGTPELIRTTMHKCLDNGASAIWPGCDIWPTVPAQNFHAMMDAVRSYGQ